MKKLFNPSAVLCLLLIIVSACGSDDGGGALSGTNLSIKDIQGGWKATSFVFGKVCDPGVDCPAISVDLLEQGITASMTIAANGQFGIIYTIPGVGADAVEGQMSFDEDLLLIEFGDSPGEAEYFSIQLTNNGNNLRLEGPGEYDFDEDGTDEPANVTIVLVRLV